MARCLELAKQGFGNVAPNPMVGCVIVYDGAIIGEGYHQQYGDAHAEVNAVNSVKNKALLNKSTLYVNLEPCAHFGKTPPCSNLIVAHNIPKVVIGCTDTFSKVKGKGVEYMQSNGVEVINNVLEKESRNLNKRFFTFHEKKRPYIILKWAESLDGFIAPENQKEAFWMTSSKSKKRVHQWRSEEMGILLGTNTVVKDNPSLTVREVNGKNPIRFVLDRTLRLPKESAVFDEKVETFILTEKPTNKNHLATDFNFLAQSVCYSLHQKGIQSIIVEGGTKTLQTFISADLWDEARVFVAPKKLLNGVKSPVINAHFSEEMVSVDQLKTCIR